MSKIHQHFQTCYDVQCPLFNDQEPSKGCQTLNDGNCRYQSIHIINGTEINQKLNSNDHGLFREWNDNGQLQIEANHVNGELNGIYRDWWDNGKLWEESNWINDKKHGKYKSWYKSGELNVECDFVNGEYHGKYKIWHRSGKLFQEFNYVNGEEV